MKPNKSSWIKLGGGALAVVIGFKLISAIFQPNSDLSVLRTAAVKKGDLKITVESTGEVKPYNRVEIKPPIAGRVEEVLVNEGDDIKQGQVVAWLSSTERAALLDAARSQGNESYQKWKTAFKAAPLTSPLDGMVIVRKVEPGQTVTTSDPVVVISDRLIIQALVDETDLSRITLGQKTEIRLDAYPAETIQGKVDHISYESTLVNNVNVYEIDIILEKTPPMFRSGMTANVYFMISDHKQVLLAPSDAIADWPKNVKRPEGAELAVYIKKFGRLIPVPVTVGQSDGRMTEILSGLKEGQAIQVVRRKNPKQTGSALGGSSSPPRGGGGRARS